ncbi:MAG: hypothetical protein A3G24_12080 [Betaproteobacteria bacterium RIFCSPLOWO2_12_FULL_62_13]|nr:MAG: hypothetical protein A3G24_12080 [Betaproteobacteria bacterium RIFCSPLOWO2_12_FULL_62_13]
MQQRRLAPRLSSLEGKTVAQLWDYPFRGDEVFDLLEEGLKAPFPGIRFAVRPPPRIGLAFPGSPAECGAAPVLGSAP